MTQKIRPLGDRVVVRREAQEEKSAGGILIPDSAKEKPMQGVVEAIGLGKRLDSGERLSLDLKIGDRILFGKYSGTEVKMGDEELVVLREDDVMGVVEA
ncbi:MAG: 10 kDa chaperonin [marine bacterium B5-7]|nr:MAG: 10 kDa chaperonin [marine bacterium B5-7]